MASIIKGNNLKPNRFGHNFSLEFKFFFYIKVLILNLNKICYNKKKNNRKYQLTKMATVTLITCIFSFDKKLNGKKNQPNDHTKIYEITQCVCALLFADDHRPRLMCFFYDCVSLSARTWRRDERQKKKNKKKRRTAGWWLYLDRCSVLLVFVSSIFASFIVVRVY